MDYINQIFVNNGFSPIESPTDIIKEKTKKTKSYESPIMIKNNQISLEKDAYERNIFYVTFNYISLSSFDVEIFFNAEEHFTKEKDEFISSEAFSSLSVKIENIPESKDGSFVDKRAKIDMDYFNGNKIFDQMYHDLIVVCTINYKNTQCKLANYLKIVKNQHDDAYHTKSEIEKIKIKGVWFDMHNIYGLESNTNECEACYTNKKNTVFLPCMHSYACSDCAVSVRIRGNKCPLCRTKITDTLIIENTK